MMTMQQARGEAVRQLTAAGYRVGSVVDFAKYAEACSLETEHSEHTGMLVYSLRVRVSFDCAEKTTMVYRNEWPKTSTA